MTPGLADALILIAALIIAVFAFLNLQWTEIQVRWDRHRETRGASVYVEIDTILRAAEYQRAARRSPRAKFVSMAKRASGFLMLVLVVSPVIGQVLPFGPVVTTIFTVGAALAGTAVAVGVAAILEVRGRTQ